MMLSMQRDMSALSYGALMSRRDPGQSAARLCR